MMVKFIKETNKKQREKIIEKMYECKHGDCDNCGICRIFSSRSPQVVFSDYIEGKREFNEIAQEFNKIRY